MSEFSFKCPQCGETVEADDSLRGQVANCPFCDKGIVIPKATGARPPIGKVNARAFNRSFPSSNPNSASRPQREDSKRSSDQPKNDPEVNALGMDGSALDRIREWILSNKKIVAISGVGICVAALLLCVIGGGEKSVKYNYQNVDEDDCPITVEASLGQAMSRPEVGKAYIHMDADVVIQRVLPGKGVLARPASRSTPQVFVETKRDYVDGAPLFPGVYICLGSMSYHVGGENWATVRAFRRMDEDLGKKRIEEIVKKAAQEEAKRKEAEELARIERQKAAELARIEKEKADAKIRAAKEAAEEVARAEREKAELAALAEKKRLEEKAEEERRKRYPEEQRVRGEYAASKLGSLDFNVAHIFNVQSSLRRYIRSAKPTEEKWEQLAALKEKKDWLGMMGLITGNQFNDYPDIAEIDEVIQKFYETEFHMEFNWTHHLWGIDVVKILESNIGKRKKEGDAVTGRRRRSSSYSDEEFIKFINTEDLSHDEGIRFEFRYSMKGEIYVFKRNWDSNSPIHELSEQFNEKMRKLEEDNRLGKIDSDQYESMSQQLKKTFVGLFKQKISTQTFRLGVNTEKPIR